ncbi:discoidin domain-containing protein [Bacteroides sp.]
MKKLSYLLLFLLSVITYGCAEEDHPYVGYIVINRALVEADGGTTTITADTDISSDMILEVDESGAEWCTVSANGKEITVNATKPNTGTSFRTTTVKVKCGYRETSFTVLQKFKGQEYLEYDWTGWTATGSDAHTEGGGYPSLFTDDQTTYWHNDYSNPQLTHWLLIDMKKELPIAMIRIGRRYYAPNGNYYPSIKVLKVSVSTDNETFTEVGGFTFALPWTAPDGTIITGNNPKIPPFEDVVFANIVTARYVKLDITETNTAKGVAQVSYFKAYEKL